MYMVPRSLILQDAQKANATSADQSTVLELLLLSSFHLGFYHEYVCSPEIHEIGLRTIIASIATPRPRTISYAL